MIKETQLEFTKKPLNTADTKDPKKNMAKKLEGVIGAMDAETLALVFSAFPIEIGDFRLEKDKIIVTLKRFTPAQIYKFQSILEDIFRFEKDKKGVIRRSGLKFTLKINLAGEGIIPTSEYDEAHMKALNKEQCTILQLKNGSRSAIFYPKTTKLSHEQEGFPNGALQKKNEIKPEVDNTVADDPHRSYIENN